MTTLAGRVPIVRAALLLLSAASSSVSLAQAGADPNALTSDQKAIVDSIAQSSHDDNVLTFKMPDGSVKEYAVAPTGLIGAKVRLPLRNGKYITLARRETVIEKDGSVSWRGLVEETDERAVLLLWNNSLLSGYVVYNGTILSVESLGGGIQAPRTAPPEPKVAPFPDAQRQALEATIITIDLMLLYTRNVAKHYIRDPEEMLSFAVDEVNETFRNSGLGNITIKLVYSQQLDYDETVGQQFNHLYRMVDGASPFQSIKKLRNEKGADIVGLIIDNPNGCGLSTRVGAEAEEAYFVVHHACATLTMSIAHEMGHILGVRHDRTVDENSSPFPYGHGYVNGTKWRTMMSYKEGCGGCPRIPYWSNPRISYKGEPTGTAASDNARVILEQAERVSKFR